MLNKKEEICDLYPLEVNYCNNCHNCQLSVAVDAKKCFQIIYIHHQLRKFLKSFVMQKIFEDFKLIKKIYIIDIGSNDDSFKAFLDLGFKKILGIEAKFS